MHTIEDFIEAYAELETDIRRLMVELFSDTCGMCTACCCRADICEEAVHSAFLSKLLKRQGVAEEDMDDRFGWLDLHGCSLDYGRPPVCYAYFCDQLLERLPDDEARLSARVLGKLIEHIGHHALGEWHLTEIMNQDDLNRVDVDGLFHRLEEAQGAFHVVEHYMQSGRLTLADREVLSAVPLDED